MTVALAAILLGCLLVYAGITGLSLGRLLQGDNLTAGRDERLRT